MDELWYDESGIEWRVTPWSPNGPGPDFPAVFADPDREDRLDTRKMYDCDADPFDALVAAIVEFDGATEEYPVRLGNVDFWRTPLGLVHGITSDEWDHDSLSADIARRMREILSGE